MRLAAPHGMTLDTFDTLRSGEIATLEIFGRAHARLLQWVDFEATRIGPDLAASWEQPDATTWVLHLDPAARWQNRAPVNGRAVTAADVLAHLERAQQLAATVTLPAVQRQGDVTHIERTTSPADGQVRIETDGADALLALTLAAPFAFVQAPEAVEQLADRWAALDPTSVVGAGPFTYSYDRDRGNVLTAFGDGHQRPHVQTIMVSDPANEVARLEAGQIDEATARDRRDAPAIQAALGSAVTALTRLEDTPVLTTLFVGAAPWSDPRLRRALSGALNRTWLAQALFAGRAAAASPLAPVFGAFGRSDADLAGFDGYRTEADADATAARALWEAAGGPALGTLTVDFPSIFDPLYSASSVIAPRLQAVLGNTVRAAVETYTTISKKALAHQYGNGVAALWFGWGPPFIEPDPSRALIERYRSTGPSFATIGFADAGIDAQLDALVRDATLAGRVAKARAIEATVLGMGGCGVLDWLVQRNEVFRRATIRRAAPTPWPAQHLDVSAQVIA
jgi:peptide/nickel transport system substrate-binding protein